LVADIGLAFLATAHGEFTAKGINRSVVSTIVDIRSRRGARRQTVGLGAIQFPGHDSIPGE
jgi:hypothetical protein